MEDGGVGFLLTTLACLHESRRYALFRAGQAGEIRFNQGCLDVEVVDCAEVVWSEARADFDEGRTVPVEGVGVFLPLNPSVAQSAIGVVFLDRLLADAQALQVTERILARLVANVHDAPMRERLLYSTLLDRADARQRLERLQLTYLLKRYNGRKADVARHLGINRHTLYYRLAKHDL